MNFVLQL